MSMPVTRFEGGRATLERGSRARDMKMESYITLA